MPAMGRRLLKTEAAARIVAPVVATVVSIRAGTQPGLFAVQQDWLHITEQPLLFKVPK
jgi:hypothetical protein